MANATLPRADDHPSIRARFWAKVDKNPGQGPQGDCWEWVAGKFPEGYGSFKFNGNRSGSHRYSFFIANGHWPNPCCLHSCDNPPCVNPRHLREGTKSDNAQDRERRGRSNHPKGKKLPIKMCIVDGCLGVSRKRNWCQRHYTRWQRHGDPMFLNPRRRFRRVFP